MSMTKVVYYNSKTVDISLRRCACCTHVISRPSCSYCRNGTDIGGGEIACVRRGITYAGSFCRKYVYDPLKREPELPRILDLGKLSEELGEDDFRL